VIHNINMSCADRLISMTMNLDPANPCDAGIMDCCLHNKPCEPEVCNVLARVLKEGDCAVDGGANVGFFSILMSRLVGPTGHVYAFEPGGNNLPKLAANLKLNAIENVEVIDKPLAARPGEIATLHEHDHPGYNSIWPDLAKDTTAKRTVETITLFSACWERHPKLIKLDVEGSELAALQGGAALLGQKPMIIAEMNEATFDRAGVSFDEFRWFLFQRGYDAFGLFEDGNLPCFIPSKVKIAPSRLNVNVLFTQIEKVEKYWPEVML
jgi:FkbM family methyltransferase